MSNSLDESSKFLRLVLTDKNLSLQKLADKLGCTKAYLGLISLQKTPLSKKYFDKIVELYPEYKDVDLNNINLTNNDVSRAYIITAAMYDSNYLNNDFISRKNSNFTSIQIDKRLIDFHYTVNKSSVFEIARIANNTLEPTFRHNDKVLLDTSVKTLSSGYMFVFYYNNDLYIREVIKNGNSIILEEPNNRNNNFTIKSEDDIEIIGLIVPVVRF